MHGTMNLKYQVIHEGNHPGTVSEVYIKQRVVEYIPKPRTAARTLGNPVVMGFSNFNVFPQSNAVLLLK